MADSEGKRKKISKWNKEEVELLLCLREEKLPQLRGVKRNSHVFKDMSVEMATKGHIYSANEIRVKIHNLTNKYRDERKSIGPSGNSNIQNEFLDDFRASNRKIKAEIEAIKEDGREALQIEGERNVILEKFLEAFKQSIRV